jgi:hypothetical protein
VPPLWVVDAAETVRCGKPCSLWGDGQGDARGLPPDRGHLGQQENPGPGQASRNQLPREETLTEEAVCTKPGSMFKDTVILAWLSVRCQAAERQSGLCLMISCLCERGWKGSSQL